MIQSSFTTIILTPTEGNYLTQVGDVDIKERVVATTIALGKNDSVDNWKEITKEEADVIKAEQDEAMKNA